jgi:alkanesulfonate monooxygenase SsuD/methylene tetrahydromethanopterin reductase-like flavin-dependent oxidoreductase (luciferase family)
VAKPSTIYPKPFQQRMPVWIAGTNPESISKAGQLGKNLASGGFLDGGQRYEHYLEAGRQAGHNLSGANYMVILSVILAPTEQEARRISERNRAIMIETFLRRGYSMDSPDMAATLPFFSGTIVGSPAAAQQQLEHILNDTRARRLIVNFRFRGISSEESRQSQRLFAAEVMPHLRHLPIK